MVNSFSRCAVVIVCCACAATAAETRAVAPKPHSAEFDSVAAHLQAFVAGDSATAVSVAVFRHGRIIWEQGFGTANFARNTPASPQTIYPVASVSKSLTATAVMVLVQRGKIDLDAPASRYLEPGILRAYTGDIDSLTVRSLLNMTGGIPHLVRFYWRDEGGAPLGEEEMVRQFGFAAFPPGRIFHYSNLSFDVLRHIVTRVSGKPSEIFMRDEVFRPLGMTHTAITLDSDQKQFEALPYQRGSHDALPLGGLEPAGGAGFHSSAHDLIAFAAALLGSPLSGQRLPLAPSTIREMWDFTRVGWYGLGWWRDPRDAKHVTVVADGSATGGAATLALVPSQGVAAVVLVNRGSGSTFDIAAELIRAALSIGEAPETNVPKMGAFPVDTAFVPTSRWLGKWVGTVALPEGRVPLRLEVRSDSTFAQFGDNAVAPLRSPELSGGLLQGTFDGKLTTAAVGNAPHRIGVTLELDGDRLIGHITAQSTGSRTRFMLPYFAELARETTPAPAPLPAQKSEPITERLAARAPPAALTPASFRERARAHHRAIPDASPSNRRSTSF
jgi:CubicO group peptidase (beta-lactamase class C family)